VSSTVAAIIGNLQNVETPWKTQLTALQGQDTAISNLGTLLSSLSNDMSSLTDFQGIMAQKTGSSSDTNVLQLTSASSSAVAGTHSVVVTSLAQTSSGYLAPIANAAATLTGSISFQVGSGTVHTIALNSTVNTLAGLAAAINSSGAGVNASVLSDSSGSRLSLVSGTSGANGNLTITSNSIVGNPNKALSYTGTAGTDTAASSGTLTSIANAADTLSGSLSIQVGSGTAQTVVIGAAPSTPAANTIYTGTGVNTLSGIMTAINTAGIGVTASVVTNSDGSSSLSLVSGTPGAAGTLTAASKISDTGTAMGYSSTVAGKDAQLTVDGVNLTSASNTVSNLIPGLTFQLLAPSPTQTGGSQQQVQVVIANDNVGVESTINQFVTDYNSLISAVNAQQGLDSSGNAEPLFGSPTLSLLQRQLLGGLNAQNPNGNLDSISTNTGTTLAGSLTIQVGSGAMETVVVGAAPSTPAANTIYTGAGVNSLSGIASAINAANIGITASVVNSGTQSTLSFLSGTAGSPGALAVTSSIVATSATLLGYSGVAGSAIQVSSGSLASIPNFNDALSGSVSIQVGSGAAQTVTLNSSDNSLPELANAINTANIGVTASVVTNKDGSASLALVSQTPGSAGSLTVTSNILDTENTTSKTLQYSNSSDVSTLANLGITVSQQDNGSLSFNVATLDSALNADFGGVVGFFQNANGWGQGFSTLLTNSGSTSSTGILKLAQNSDSNIEATLNANVSKEESIISIQQKSLTAELNSANQIMQSLPSQLLGVNELYAAITGYNQNTNG
jgi:flagellar hook-associated protein 2